MFGVQVQVDITELRSKWGQPRVERVTNNTFKLWQVRENLKKSKTLYVEEERLLGEFKKVSGRMSEVNLLPPGQGCPHLCLHG